MPLSPKATILLRWFRAIAALLALMLAGGGLTVIGIPALAQEADPAVRAQIEALEKQIAAGEAAVAGGAQAAPQEEMKLILAMVTLANLYVRADRIEDSWPLSERMLARVERVFGPEHPMLVGPLEATAATLTLQGRTADAEKRRRRALAINERTHGKESLQVANSLQGMAQLLRIQDRYDEALEFARRALEIALQKLPNDDKELAIYFAQVANIQLSSKRFEEAAPNLRRALALLDGRPTTDPSQAALTIQVLQGLALAEIALGRFDQAQPLIDRAIEAATRTFGPEHVMTGTMHMTLAQHMMESGELEQAEALFIRALPISQRNRRLATMLADNYVGLGAVAYKRKDWRGALDYLRRAGEIAVAQESITAAAPPLREGKLATPWADPFLLQALAAFKVAAEDAPDRLALRDEAFQVAQRAERSLVAGALTQMSARLAKGSGPLALLIRERQDLVLEWQRLDKRFEAFLAAPADRRDERTERLLQTRLEQIRQRMDSIDARLAKEFPDFSKLSDPTPLSLSDVQSLLAPGEVLVFMAQRPSETLVWVVGQREVGWHVAPIGETELSREVALLRCSLDIIGAADSGADCGAGSQELSDGSLPFDTARAYRIYQALLEPAAALTRDANLIVVASGPLARLPLHVLVTEPPTSGGRIAWLARRNAVSQLPSVASLKALRNQARPSSAERPYFAMANPLLLGPDQGHVARADLARAWQSCAAIGGVPAAALPRTSVTTLQKDARTSQRPLLQSLAPLPETAIEVCRAARTLGAQDDDVRLGASASKAVLKNMSSNGELRRYKILHFATHGALAGELEPTSEAGLVLTPPPLDLPTDDGFLTASEISELQLDADWVILSACNTAGAARTGEEPLSGLARAFAFAGARSLLVSHWAVNSDATVKLVTRAVAEMAGGIKLGRAEALRRAMIALIDEGAPHEAHPAYWSPFVLIGEGSR